MVGVCERAWRHVPVNSCVSRGLEVSPSPLARNEAFTPFSFHAVEAAQSVPPRTRSVCAPPKPHGHMRHAPDAPNPPNMYMMPKPDSRFQTPDHAPDARPWSGRRALGPWLCLLRPSFLVCFLICISFPDGYEFVSTPLCRLETLIQCLQLSSSRV